jgi:antitoxin MazE
MRVTIRKWGNSLALRIPKSVAAEAFLADESVVDLKVVNGRIVVSSVEPETSLERLLADVDECNLHGAVPTGPTGRAGDQ